MHAAASFLPCTVMRTISAPASTQRLTSATVPATSRVSAAATKDGLRSRRRQPKAPCPTMSPQTQARLHSGSF